MNAFARGDVFWADLPEGRAHPVLIVTRQAAIPIRSSVTVVLVTSTSRGHPAEVSLDVEDGFAHPSVANCDEIYTISKSRLTERLGSIPFETMLRVEGAIRLSLDLD